MKKTNVLIIMLGFLFFLSCKKDKNCELNGTGTIEIENQSNVEYEVTMNMDSTFIIAPDKTLSIPAPVGEHELIAVRTDSFGSIFPPSTWGTFSMEVCQVKNLVID